jgi:SAM-dependent methyltransferase
MQNMLDAGDWAERYREGRTSWDLGEPHPELLRRIDSGELAPPSCEARALVPGCGRGHDARALAAAGWNVTAVDLVPELSSCFEGLSGAGTVEFVAGDVFEIEFSGTFELLWEHTFFCTLARDPRLDYGRLAHRLVSPGGRVAAIVFPVGKPVDDPAPPFAMATRDLGSVLDSAFELSADEPVARATGGRRWLERYASFTRICSSD